MIRVMIVDDEVLARIGMQAFLQKHENIRVENTFSQATDALAYLENNKNIDVVITDIEMSEMDGLDFIKEMREQRLANGIIIVSCHDKFDYARQAMELGADYYILKQEIDEKKLVQAIEKAYGEKISQTLEPSVHSSMETIKRQINDRDVWYAIGVLKRKGQYDSHNALIPAQVDESMLMNLIDNIVKKSEMGTLFTPYKKDMFILFQLPKNLEENERERVLHAYCEDLFDNVQIFTNGKLLIGCSGYFTELQKVREKYEEALMSLKQHFYDRGDYFFFPRDTGAHAKPNIQFTSDQFLEDNGICLFEEELAYYIKLCRDAMMDAEWLKRTLIVKLNILVYQVIHAYAFSYEGMKKWEERFNEAAMQIQDSYIMEENIRKIMRQFHEELLVQIRNDGFNAVLQFIEEHIQEEISLAEMANLNGMSMTHFCKKFKERTGMTLIGYVNQKKVEQIKSYLNADLYSLERIAELAGFKNANYMIRLFKKVTGVTVGEYRRSHLVKKVIL